MTQSPPTSHDNLPPHEAGQQAGAFAALGLDSALCKAAGKAGFKTPTLVQKAGIPPILEGKDVLLPGQTGSGKTAAFLLPALQNLCALKEGEEETGYAVTRLLVLEPTRDLALQTASVCRQLGRMLPLRTRVICGGTSREQQCKSLERGADIIIATHGRLLDLVQQGDLVLSEIALLVLDEADRLLDEEFSASMTALVPYLSDRPQTIFCSATLPEPVMALARKVTRNPVRVTVEETGLTPGRMTQQAVFLEEEEKDAFLLKILSGRDMIAAPGKDLKKSRKMDIDPARGRCILFVKTKHHADRLAKLLCRHGHHAASLHSGQTQGGRNRTLEQFQRDAVSILVTTDIAARGLDIAGITLVVNVDMPNTPEIYIHRIGRTARAGQRGSALSLVTPAERGLLRETEQHLQNRIRIIALPPL